MKKIILFVSQAAFGICLLNAQPNAFPANGTVGIGTTTPHASAALEIKSTTQGLLIPRMYKSQRDAITSPATGLFIYQLDKTPGFYFYNGSSWQPSKIASANKKLSNLTSPTAVNVALNPAGDNAINLGSATNSWRDLYIDGEIYFHNDKVFQFPGSGNCFIGLAAGNASTSGNDNTAVGYLSFNNNTSGILNTAVGSNALRYNITGNTNVGIGDAALFYNNTGSENTAIGTYSMFYNTGGNYNTASGISSLLQNTTGGYNTAFGHNSLYSNTTGFYNTAVGKDAFLWSTDARYNTAVGYGAGNSYIFGWNNTLIGAETDANGSGYYNSIALGNVSTVTNVNQARIGNSSTNSIGGFANWTNISDGRFKKNIKEDVKGMDFISKLRPVTYNLDVTGLSEKLNEGRGHEVNETLKKAIVEKEKIIYSGFIAQEVEKAAQETGYDFSGVDKAKSENDMYGLRYAEFVVPLVKAVQELAAELAEIKSMLTPVQQQKLNDLKNTTGSKLDQNSPNPFNAQTEIKFQLPERYASAQLVISDESGKTIKICNLQPSAPVQIKAGELAAGRYSYSLFIDDKLVDSKQMVLTK